MRNKAFSRLLLLAGAVLLAAAGFALLGARQKTARQAELSDSLRDMQALLSEPAAGVTGDRTDGEMPQLELNGRDYIGLLELPERGITLPVAADWDTGLFSFHPARYNGVPIHTGKEPPIPCAARDWRFFLNGNKMSP